jgi:hypothetical protein
MILQGEPRASGRIDERGANGGHRPGIRACTAGTLECGPGDSVFTRRGERVTWDIHEDVVKVFFSDLHATGV